MLKEEGRCTINKSIKKATGLLMCCYLLFLASGTILPVHAVDGVPEDVPVEYEGYIVKIKDSENAKMFSNRKEITEPMEKIMDEVYWTEDEKTVQKLVRTGLADYVEPNYKAELFEAEGGEISTGWAYEKLNISYAREFSLNGEGISVAVIDSGIDKDNPDLQNANIADGYDYVDETSEMSDDVYHGTRVAQIIAGDENNLGGTGIAPRTTMVPLRCFSSSNGGTVKVLIKAINDAIDQYQCDIINMSWGMSSESKALHEAISYAHEKGVILIAASGNVTSSFSSGTTMYPAAFDEVIGVSSVDVGMNIASDSQYHEGVFVCAPGVSVPVVMANGRESTTSGTSFAAPCVSAEVALLLQLAPFMNSNDIKELLRQRSVDLGEEGYDVRYGYGFPAMDEILNNHWGRIVSDQDSGRTRMIAWVLHEGGSSLIINEKSREGRQQRVTARKSGAAILSAELEFETESGTTQMVFLDDRYSPISPFMVSSNINESID